MMPENLQTSERDNVSDKDPETTQTLENLITKLENQTQLVAQQDGIVLPVLAQSDALQEELHQLHGHFTKVSRQTYVTSYAGEWFLDNFYIILESVQQVSEDMPETYYKQLPKLAKGEFAGYPRVYILAHALNHFLNCRITPDELTHFITNYQERVELTTAELWAFPTMLRIVALETISAMLGHLLEQNVRLSTQFTPLVIKQAFSRSANADLIVGNCVTSLRTTNTQNWKDFFEAVSHVEAILRNDPSGTYALMDFETRNQYRLVIEHLMRHSDYSEKQIANTVLKLASDHPRAEITSHIGYYLIDEGLAQTRQAIDYRRPWKKALGESLLAHGLLVYLGSIALMTILLMLVAGLYALANEGSPLQIILSMGLVLIPSITFAVHMVNYAITKIVSPQTLPKLDFSAGVDSASRTMVVIPAMLTDMAEVKSLIKQLEQHYLRNLDNNLFFAVLADYPDASEEQMPSDEELQKQMLDGIRNLNSRYGKADQRQPFYFFLRKRMWNASENSWMGYERKRGKLAEFNRLLLHPDSDTSYIVKYGNLDILPTIRYVITLDADTILPRDSARRLVGTFAHPLNCVRFDANGQVIGGYTILQPRVEILPMVANQTLFTRIFAGESGLDLYTLAVSDIYNDLFAEGIYVGKGIYDVAAFERSLENKVPDNALLSHDLFEGLQGRATLVTDVVLFEDYPTHYLAHAKRLHRWVRGDWQLLPWLFPRVPIANGGTQANRFSTLALWKIIDNLRRSTIQPMLLLLILGSWFGLPGSAFFWTGCALLIFLIPFLIGIINRIDAITVDNNLSLAQQRRLRVSLMQWLISIVFLPYEAFIRLDAIFITFYRLIRRKRLLEWTTSARVSQLFQNRSSRNAWSQMLPSLVIVTVITAIAIYIHPASVFVAVPMLLLWWMAPIVVDFISRPLEVTSQSISEEDRNQLRTLARRTWLFFEEFVGPDDNWLPPDHYQHTPISKVGHYTSPTNIGLMLLSTLAAYDLGYIGVLDFITRLQFSFESIARLERYQGHLLNWYNTETLKPLLPRYVSTVDNGNFAASLLILKQGCDDLWNLPVLREERWYSVQDTLQVLNELIGQLAESNAIDDHELIQETQRNLNTMYTEIHFAPHNEWVGRLNDLMEDNWKPVSESLSQLVAKLGSSDISLVHDIRIYLSRLHHHLSNMRRDLDMLLPWHTAFQNIPSSLKDGNQVIEVIWTALHQIVWERASLVTIHHIYKQVEEQVRQLQNFAGDDSQAQEWCSDLIKAVRNARNMAAGLLQNIRRIHESIDTEFNAMDFRVLYNAERHLFHIGYNIDAEQLDNSFYDLLASEARLASFLAIARQEVPQKHWMQLSRPIGQIGDQPTLLSWSGTMFEYLMPALFMRDYDDTLLHQSYQTAVDTQIQYAHQHKTPWGISESGYYAFDNNQSYQYRAFGVPSLAFKRGQDRDLVIAPYASLLALPIAPVQVMQNIEYLIKQHALTTYGFVEAIDYTPNRLPAGLDRARVQEYMAHHQAMSLLALTNCLKDNVMVRRFHRDPRVESVELLLMEKIPDEPIVEQVRQPSPETDASLTAISIDPWEVPTEPAFPEAHYLSNGRYSVMISSSGGGYSQWNNRAITRWRADSTLDDWGQWFYIHDEESGQVWSPTAQPFGNQLELSRAMFHMRRVEFQSRTYDITSQLDILVPADTDLEIRKLRLINHSGQDRRLTICSYAEMVMAPQNSDQRHPAFNKMFLHSEYLAAYDGLLFQRRLRSAHDDPMFVLHMLVASDIVDAKPQYETDRARFLGRNRGYRNPIVFDNLSLALSGTTGETLDPIMALSQTITIPAHSTYELAFVTIAGNSRHTVENTASHYHKWERIERAYNHTRYDSNTELHRLGVQVEDIARYQKLLSALLYPNPQFRADSQTLAANIKSQSGLWAYGVSGDYPIVLAQISNEDHLELVYDLLQAHRFWRSRGFASTFVILNTGDTGYMQELYGQIHNLVVSLGSETWMNRHDGVFILRSDQLNDEDRHLLRTAARVFLMGENGSLQHQLDAQPSGALGLLPLLTPSSTPEAIEDTSEGLKRPTDWQFDNGLGGFSSDGREYQMFISKAQTSPAPWINVIANPDGGFIFSEAGGGFSWGQNSGENRMTNWRNDPVTDMPAEAIYLRDEETTLIWSPTLLPAGTDAPYLVRHGAGYSIVEHHSEGMRQTVTTYMAPDETVKFVRVRLKNTATRPRRITITYYAEWVLGPVRDMTQQYLIPEFDAPSETILVHNPYSMEFGSYHAFLTADRKFHGMTTNRTEFLGRMGNYAQPAALRRLGLNNTVRAGLDLCGVVQLHVDLPVDGEDEVCFVIGSGKTRNQALELSQRYNTTEAIHEAYETSINVWQYTLDSIVVRTPDPAMNVLLPWLLYQALSCRVWGRSALYQSSGAYGFRDQLQDVLSLVHTRPDLTRDQILRAARHQFEAGDVLHWWHPPTGRGVRTRFSDDLVWLPFVVSHYIEMTGDTSVLDAQEPFLKGEPLRPEEEERYGFYEPTSETYSIYEHCQRALNKAYDLGQHQLPLMKAGDWNDGMNRVGIEGRGESVWMGWFLYTSMDHFSQLCEDRADTKLAEMYRERMDMLKNALDEEAWDGAWYLRAFYDDGTPLGSHQNMECQIDSLTQSWSILSDVGNSERTETAMQSVESQLVDFENGLIRLFTPPFNHTSRDPGYIKGYPPGIRENGGQYTHAALWVIWAFAKMGNGDLAWRLFDLLNPIQHSDTPAKVQTYRVEPYVVAADVYSTEPHIGRGGWTWYTGSSGWMYRLGVEAILGIYRQGDYLVIQPRTASHWEQYEVDYRYGTSVYKITVLNPYQIESGQYQAELDGQALHSNQIPLVDDGQEHTVIVRAVSHQSLSTENTIHNHKR